MWLLCASLFLFFFFILFFFYIYLLAVETIVSDIPYYWQAMMRRDTKIQHTTNTQHKTLLLSRQISLRN